MAVFGVCLSTLPTCAPVHGPCSTGDRERDALIAAGLKVLKKRQLKGHDRALVGHGMRVRRLVMPRGVSVWCDGSCVCAAHCHAGAGGAAGMRTGGAALQYIPGRNPGTTGMGRG
jgi:hypothetical protein